MSILAASKQLDAVNLGDDISYRKLAGKHNVCRSTLIRQAKGVLSPREDDRKCVVHAENG
jgi:hypothetical protein